MANVGSLGQVEYVETFIGDNIAASAADGVTWVTLATDGTAFARAAAAARGLHIAGATPATDDKACEICGDTLHVFGQTGYNMFEVLFMADVVTTLAFNIGFNDDSLEASPLPIELSGTTWTTNATDSIMLVYDVDATNDDVHCMWVDDGNDATDAIATLRMNGIAPVASKWCMARVELQDRGSGNGVWATFTFQVDGKTAVKEYKTSLDRDVGLCYYVGFENRDAVAHNLYIKYMKTAQSIAD